MIRAGLPNTVHIEDTRIPLILYLLTAQVLHSLTYHKGVVPERGSGR